MVDDLGEGRLDRRHPVQEQDLKTTLTGTAAMRQRATQATDWRLRAIAGAAAGLKS